MVDFICGMFVLLGLIGYAAAVVAKAKIGWSWVNNKWDNN
jgi:hypothetical protein